MQAGLAEGVRVQSVDPLEDLVLGQLGLELLSYCDFLEGLVLRVDFHCLFGFIGSWRRVLGILRFLGSCGFVFCAFFVVRVSGGQHEGLVHVLFVSSL